METDSNRIEEEKNNFFFLSFRMDCFHIKFELHRCLMKWRMNLKQEQTRTVKSFYVWRYVPEDNGSGTKINAEAHVSCVMKLCLEFFIWLENSLCMRLALKRLHSTFRQWIPTSFFSPFVLAGWASGSEINNLHLHNVRKAWCLVLVLFLVVKGRKE